MVSSDVFLREAVLSGGIKHHSCGALWFSGSRRSLVRVINCNYISSNPQLLMIRGVLIA